MFKSLLRPTFICRLSSVWISLCFRNSWNNQTCAVSSFLVLLYLISHLPPSWLMFPSHWALIAGLSTETQRSIWHPSFLQDSQDLDFQSSAAPSVPAETQKLPRNKGKGVEEQPKATHNHEEVCSSREHACSLLQHVLTPVKMKLFRVVGQRWRPLTAECHTMFTIILSSTHPVSRCGGSMDTFCWSFFWGDTWSENHQRRRRWSPAEQTHTCKEGAGLHCTGDYTGTQVTALIDYWNSQLVITLY